MIKVTATARKNLRRVNFFSMTEHFAQIQPLIIAVKDFNSCLPASMRVLPQEGGPTGSKPLLLGYTEVLHQEETAQTSSLQ